MFTSTVVCILRLLCPLRVLASVPSRNCYDEGRMDPITPDPVNRIFLALCSTFQFLVLSHQLVSTVRCSLPKYVLLSTVTVRQFTMLALLLCRDTELNPGPSSDNPCGYCGLNVTWSRPAVACDECSVWYHKSCYSMSDSKYDRLADEPWVCQKCKTLISSAHTFHSYELDSEHVIHMESESNSNVTAVTVIPLSHPQHPLSHSIIVLLFLRTVVLHQQKHIVVTFRVLPTWVLHQILCWSRVGTGEL